MTVNFLYMTLTPGLSGNTEVLECEECHAIIQTGREDKHEEWHNLITSAALRGQRAYEMLRVTGLPVDSVNPSEGH